jgi:hypothetical protein
MKSIAGRKVRLFRCQIPPLIGPKILNAHIPKDLGWEAEVDATTTGVVITLANGTEHFVPFTNIQNTELYPLEQSGPVEIMEAPKRIGRPPKSGAI